MTNLLNYEKMLNKMLRDKKPNTCIITENMETTPLVLIGTFSECDYTDLPIIYTEHVGGTLVLFPGDLTFTYLTKESKITDIVSFIIDYLSTYEPEVYLKDNDVMLGDNKLFGTMETSVDSNNLFYGGFFLSFTPDIDLINTVSSKEMHKVPLGLSSIIKDKNILINMINEVKTKFNMKEV